MKATPGNINAEDKYRMVNCSFSINVLRLLTLSTSYSTPRSFLSLLRMYTKNFNAFRKSWKMGFVPFTSGNFQQTSLLLALFNVFVVAIRYVCCWSIVANLYSQHLYTRNNRNYCFVIVVTITNIIKFSYSNYAIDYGISSYNSNLIRRPIFRLSISHSLLLPCCVGLGRFVCG